MSDSIETILVIRKNHPLGKVLINLEDKLDSDIVYSEPNETNQEPQLKSKRIRNDLGD